MVTVYFNTSLNMPLQIVPKLKNGAWVYVEAPTDYELEQIATQYKLDIDLLRDGIDANESPRIERSDGSTYVYTRFCLPESEKQTTAPLLAVMASDVLITISKHPFAHLQSLVALSPQTNKRAQLLLELLNEINTGYKRRINRVSKRIWEIRSQLDKAHINNKDFVTFIDIEEDLSDFLLALEPMNAALNNLLTGKYFRIYEDDRDLIEDLELNTEELINLAGSRLKTIQNIREAYSTMTANNLNKVFKLMTSITILMSIFTIITGIYSMNIALPLARNPYVFWVILAVAFGIISVLAVLFRRKKWL